MRDHRSKPTPRTSQQLCATCAIVNDLVEIAQTDLQEGRFDDVDKALRLMQAHLTGALGVEVR